MLVSLIVAVDRNGLIGREGKLPWHLPADLRWFRQTTTGHHVIMGRATWCSIGKALRGRTNVVVTRSGRVHAPGAIVVGSLDDALALGEAAGDPEVFVIGGAALYQTALPRADRLYVTRIDAVFEGDVHFPEIGPAWIERSREDHAPDEKNPYPYAFCILERGDTPPASPLIGADAGTPTSSDTTDEQDSETSRG